MIIKKLKEVLFIVRKPTKKELQERERQRKLQRLQTKRMDSKTHFIESVSSLRGTLRHHKRLRRQISLYLEASPETYRDIEELAEKVQKLNKELEDIIQFKTTSQEGLNDLYYMREVSPND